MVNAIVFGQFVAGVLTGHSVRGAIVDKGGNSYLLHLMRVMMRLRTEDLELMMIAIGHDALEDKVLTEAELYALGATERVMTALRLLNHDPRVPYQQYVEAMGNNFDCIRVKIEDIRDNSDITRGKPYNGNSPEEAALHEKKQLNRIHKYQTAYAYLIQRRKALEP